MRKSIVVYNRFDLDSLFAAAIARTQLVKLGNDVSVYDDSQSLPEVDGEYIWVGVEPATHRESFYSRVAGQRHVFFNLAHEENVSYPPEPQTLRNRLSSIIHRDRQAMVEGNNGALPTLLERVALVYGYGDECVTDKWSTFTNEPPRSQMVRRLAHHVQNFLDIESLYGASRMTGSDGEAKDNVKEALVFVYASMVSALRCIRDHQLFVLREPVEQDHAMFAVYLNSVKSKLRGNYTVRNVVHRDTKAVEKVLYISVSDEDYYWAIRLVRKVHRIAVNVFHGINGTVLAGSGMNLSDYRLEVNGRAAGHYA